MSLEAAITQNTETLLKLLDATERLIGLRVDAVETVKAAAAPEKKVTKPAAEPKAEITTNPEDRKPPAEDKAAALRSAADKHPIGKLVLAYVGSGYDEAHADAKAEREARFQKVKAMYGAIGTQLGITVNSYADIPEQHTAKVVGKLELWISEGNLVIKTEEAALDL